MWKNDKELFELINKELYTPVVGDILDGLGKYYQFLPANVRQTAPSQKVIGRAMPVNMIDVYGEQEKPFGLLTEALDQLQEGDVYICSGGTNRCAYWGELLTATAKARKAVGAVINGYHRDTPQMLEQNFPVFSIGSYAQDSSVRTKVVSYREPIEVGGVWINNGDLVFADVDGVLIIPKEVEKEVVEKALEKARGEKTVRKAVEEGMSSTEAYAKYGIL